MKEVADANFPKTSEGRVYHVGVKRGEGRKNVIISIARNSVTNSAW